MKIPKYVTEYIEEFSDTDKHRVNKERLQLFDYLEKNILNRNDIEFDIATIDNFINFTEKYYFELKEFQKFLISFVFLYYKDNPDRVVFDQFLWLMARGSGKNGLISAITHFLISELHDVRNYDITVVANSEKQAMTSFNDVYEVIELNNMYSVGKKKKSFKVTKQKITSEFTNSSFQFATSSADTKDGGREGAVIYDEIHQYTNSDIIDVFSGGLGKVLPGREFFITTDGTVREGVLDKMKDRARDILDGKVLDDTLFPWICKLDSQEEVKDEQNWAKANPQFEGKMSPYAIGLFEKTKRQYRDMKRGSSNRIPFLTKRMNIPVEDSSVTVAKWEDILATSKPIPFDEIEGKECIGGVDYADVKDFTSVGLLFNLYGEIIWVSHTFARKEYLEEVTLAPPIDEWVQDGLITVVDDVLIDPMLVAEWFEEMRNKYNLEIPIIMADAYRASNIRGALEDYGFEMETIRNPRGIHSLLAPKIETLFAKQKITFGDNPLMRWFTNNVLVKVDPRGNKTFEKKSEHSMKTDGFQAFVHALYKEDELIEESVSNTFDFLNSMKF